MPSYTAGLYSSGTDSCITGPLSMSVHRFWQFHSPCFSYFLICSHMFSYFLIFSHIFSFTSHSHLIHIFHIQSLVALMSFNKSQNVTGDLPKSPDTADASQALAASVAVDMRQQTLSSRETSRDTKNIETKRNCACT